MSKIQNSKESKLQIRTLHLHAIYVYIHYTYNKCIHIIKRYIQTNYLLIAAMYAILFDSSCL